MIEINECMRETDAEEERRREMRRREMGEEKREREETKEKKDGMGKETRKKKEEEDIWEIGREKGREERREKGRRERRDARVIEKGGKGEERGWRVKGETRQIANQHCSNCV